MILHVTFSDGSNPWVSFNADPQTIAKHWRRWVKNHPDTAEPVAIGKNGWMCYFEANTGFYCVERTTIATIKIKKYKHLGHALRALERLGGEKP